MNARNILRYDCKVYDSSSTCKDHEQAREETTGELVSCEMI